jgi:hypothetical protein
MSKELVDSLDIFKSKQGASSDLAGTHIMLVKCNFASKLNFDGVNFNFLKYIFFTPASDFQIQISTELFTFIWLDFPYIYIYINSPIYLTCLSCLS